MFQKKEKRLKKYQKYYRLDKGAKLPATKSPSKKVSSEKTLFRFFSILK